MSVCLSLYCCIKCNLECVWLQAWPSPQASHQSFTQYNSFKMWNNECIFLSYFPFLGWIKCFCSICISVSTTPNLSTPIFPPSIPKNSLFGSYSATTNATYLHGNRPAILFLIAVRCAHVWSVDQMTIREAAPPHSKQRQGDVKGEILQYLSLLSSVASLTSHLCSRMCFVLFLACSHVLTQQTLPYSTVSCWYIIHFVHDAFHVFSSAFG